MDETAKSPLDIRHELVLREGRYIVRENFGGQKPMEFEFQSVDEGKRFIEKRRAALLEMVASISDEAREAVEDARYIDNMPSGKA